MVACEMSFQGYGTALKGSDDKADALLSTDRGGNIPISASKQNRMLDAAAAFAII